jgi:hypothetical protein
VPNIAGQVVLLSAAEDPTAMHFARFCSIMGLPIVWLKLDDLVYSIPEKFPIILERLDSASGVYYREPESCNQDEAMILGMLRSRVQYHHRSIYPPISSTNFSKALHVADGIVPLSGSVVQHIETLVVTREFPEGNKWVSKSVSSWKTMVTTNDKPSKIIHGKSCPVLFQPRITGLNVRVHVLRDYVCSLAVDSSDVDYRYAGDAISKPFILPNEAISWCINMTEREGLVFSGVDLITEADQWWCFEINPNPGYHWYEAMLGSNKWPISSRLYSYLSDGVIAEPR